jgi:hypothetical protein
MGLDRDLVDLLKRIGEPDREDRVLRLQGCDGPVEMPLAVADAAAPAVESHKGHQQRAGEYLGRIGPRLAHAEAALDEHVAGLPEAPAQVGMEDLGQGHVLPAVEKRLHEGAGIDLAADRPIAPDRGDVLKVWKV